ncbi:MAG: glutamine--tRNA ligase/YqeY domain fusion protein [Planctomycetaceae bacterium]|nr:glutamine--tRNA ligase/YqeY domain fusion protein [Planctomycetaceae bacterium]
MSETDVKPPEHRDFVRQIVEDDLRTGKWNGIVHTRFPPEPNGYLHIGHAKSICLNFGIAQEYNGKCNLRFDDTNPEKEEVEYVESIKEDIRWLGFDWEDRLFFASDYFEQLYQWAEQLIRDGKAYVCSLSLDEIRAGRGTPSEPGTDSPYRSRSVEENLELFRAMRAGKFDEGQHVLRAKIDMGHKVMLLRDPIMYRIRKVEHHRTGDQWCIYPTYDYTHGQSDSLEGITHSICTLEFENRRPLYDWFCENLGIHHPQQIEFNRLNLTYTVMSKRRLLELVREGYVNGWDDPRMPTISGLRRRGYTPESIRTLCTRVGVTKHNAVTDMVVLENCIREELNRTADRRMAVLDPLKVVITNYPEGQSELLDAVNNPEDESAGSRQVPFGRELYIEREDFMEDPPKSFFRLGPGREVRLRWAYFIKCHDVVKDADGNVTEIHCTFDPESKGGNTPDGRKVKATLHWVHATSSVQAEVRLYDHLFSTEDPDQVADDSLDWRSNLNPKSLEVVTAAVEPSLETVSSGYRCQFERKGYFFVDKDSSADRLIFNRIVTLKDAWAKASKKGS